MRLGIVALVASGTLSALLPAHGSAPAHAAEWYLNADASEDFGFDDNYDLDPEGSRSAWVSTTRLAATVGGRNPILDLSLNGSASYSRFLDTNRSSADAESLAATARRQGRRSVADLAFAVAHDTTLADPKESGSRAQADERRLTFDLDTSYAYRLTPLDLLDLEAGWRHRTYPDASDDDQAIGDDEFVDYDFWSGDVGWLRNLTRRAAAGPGLSAGHFDSSRERTTTLGATFDLNYGYAQLIDLRFGAGPSFYWSDSEEDGGNGDSGLGYILNGTADARLTPRTEASLSLGHGIGPGGDDGGADEVTQVGIGLDHAISRYVDLLLDATYYRQRTLTSASGGDGGDEDRDYLEVSPALAWRPRERWEASLIYRFRSNEEQDGEDGAAVSNGIFLRLAYELPRSPFPW